MSLDKKKVWRRIQIQNIRTGTTKISNSATVWLSHTGAIFWNTDETLYIGCEMNVIKYPFDKHQFEFICYSERYQNTELLVDFRNNKVDLS